MPEPVEIVATLCLVVIVLIIVLVNRRRMWDMRYREWKYRHPRRHRLVNKCCHIKLRKCDLWRQCKSDCNPCNFGPCERNF